MRWQLHIVLAYALAVTIALVVVLANGSRLELDELTVRRLNVVGEDGALKLLIANETRFPGPILNGVESKRSSSHPGMLFFNDEGDECGGLVFRGEDGDASASLLFDQHKQDQVVGLTYGERKGNDGAKRIAGLRVWDRPELPLDEVLGERTRINGIEDGEAKTREIESFLGKIGFRDPFGAQRLFVGRDESGRAGVFLRDRAARIRARLCVGADGAAALEFLDENGTIVSRVGP